MRPTPPRPNNTRTPPSASPMRFSMGAAPFKPSTVPTDYSSYNAGPPMGSATSKPDSSGLRAGPPMGKHEWQSGGGDILVKAVKKEAQGLIL